jgi:hypothetical protein
MSREKRERINLGWVAGLASAAAVLAALGCSSSDPGDAPGCDPAANADCADVGGACTSDNGCASGRCSAGACVASDVSGGGGSGSATGDGTGGTFILVDDLEPSQGGSGPAVCVDLEVDFERVTPTVVLLIDRSGSMTQNFENGVDRWDTLVNTLTDPQSSLVKKLEGSVRFGMSLYTSEGGFGGGDTPRECPILTSVGIGLGNFSEISSVLKVEANGPSGDTPTAESMARVAAELTAFGEEGPKSIILATDGDPDTCADPMANNNAGSKDLSVAAVRAAYVAGIPTHVISVGNQVTASHLKALAEAGAGGDPSAEAYTALNTAALVSAFSEIIGSVRTCDFTLAGTVKAGSAGLGTVVLDGAPLVFGSADGWEMPNESTVRLLGQACETVQEDASGISMTFPCDVIQIIPR